MESIPIDIRNLPRYFVSLEYFIVTSIILILFLIISVLAVVHWSYRVRKGLINPDYIANFNIRLEIMNTKKDIPMKPSDE